MDRVTLDIDPILISLDFGRVSERCRTNHKIQKILTNLKDKQNSLPEGYVSVCEVNKLVVLILQEVLKNIEIDEDEYG